MALGCYLFFMQPLSNFTNPIIVPIEQGVVRKQQYTLSTNELQCSSKLALAWHDGIFFLSGDLDVVDASYERTGNGSTKPFNTPMDWYSFHFLFAPIGRQAVQGLDSSPDLRMQQHWWNFSLDFLVWCLSMMTCKDSANLESAEPIIYRAIERYYD